MRTLKLRKDFLAFRQDHSPGLSCPAFVMRVRPVSGALAFGFIVTRKMGGAVQRNRLRRRIKEAARIVFQDLPVESPKSWHILFIARKALGTVPFTHLMDKVRQGFETLSQQNDRCTRRG